MGSDEVIRLYFDRYPGTTLLGSGIYGWVVRFSTSEGHGRQ
jgi:hypothetical protein